MCIPLNFKCHKIPQCIPSCCHHGPVLDTCPTCEAMSKTCRTFTWKMCILKETFWSGERTNVPQIRTGSQAHKTLRNGAIPASLSLSLSNLEDLWAEHPVISYDGFAPEHRGVKRLPFFPPIPCRGLNIAQPPLIAARPIHAYLLCNGWCASASVRVQALRSAVCIWS